MQIKDTEILPHPTQKAYLKDRNTGKDVDKRKSFYTLFVEM